MTKNSRSSLVLAAAAAVLVAGTAVTAGILGGDGAEERAEAPPAERVIRENAAQQSGQPPRQSLPEGRLPAIVFDTPPERPAHTGEGEAQEEAVRYIEVGAYSEGLAAAELEDEFHYLDEDGNVAFVVDKRGFDMTAGPFQGGLAAISVYVNTDPEIATALGFDANDMDIFAMDVFGLIDRTGAFVLPMEYYGTGDPSYWTESGTLFVKEFPRSGRWGVIDRSGKFLVEPIYEVVNHSYENRERYAFLLDDKWGFLDACGQVVVEAQYEMVCDFEDGEAEVFDIYRFCVVLEKAQYFSELFGQGDYYNLTAMHSFTIDMDGQVIRDDGRLRVETLSPDSSEHESKQYVLPGYPRAGNALRDIRFDNMAVVNYNTRYLPVYFNAQMDADGNWYLTEEYPPIRAYLQDGS